MRDEASSPSSQPISFDDVTTSFEGPNVRVTWGGTVDYDQRDEAPLDLDESWQICEPNVAKQEAWVR